MMKGQTVLNALSKHLLIEGLDDWVMFGALYAPFIGKTYTKDEFVTSMRAAVEPLLYDGLMVIGDLSSPLGFRAWDLSIPDSLDRAEAMYRNDPKTVGQTWDWEVWLCLTPAGEVLAKQLYEEDPDPLGLDADGIE